MPQFAYKAMQHDGVLIEGNLDANNRQEAMRQVSGRGLKPIRLTEAGATRAPFRPAGEGKPANGSAAKNGASAKNGSGGKNGEAAASIWNIKLGESKKITPRMLENFTRLLSSLLAAGVPFSRALVILHREAASPAAKSKWKEIHDLVIDGMSLSDAMARSPDTFPRVYVAMVEAGEAGGFLDVVLAQIADFQAREKELQSKVVTALMYPAILLVLAFGVLVFLMVFFIPRFQLVFKGFNAELPALTQAIVGVSNMVRSYGLFIAVAAVVGIFFARTWLRSEKGKRVWEGWILKAPMFGPLIAQFAMARFCRMLGTLLGAGVPLINALNVARRSIGNQILVDAVSDSIDRVKEGKPLGTSLAQNRDLFPGAVVEMISVAEESGKLDHELLRIAGVTESDLDRQLKAVVALAEPMMLFLIAALVGTIFIGMVIPIFSLLDHIK
ncbi:MAG: type II secretion system F family protein [Verrucomicrobiota bacterium]